MKTHILKCILAISAASAVSGALSQTPGDWLLDSIPGQWNYVSQHRQKLPAEDDWWNTFEDQTLDSLISLAERENFNVAAALSRIEMAKNALRLSKSSYYPDLSLSAGWTKGQSSGASSRQVIPSAGYSYFSLGATMQWEIDLFGRITQNARAAKAAYSASRAEYDGVMVSLAANVAKAYIDLRMCQNQLLAAQNHLAEQKKVLAIVEARFKAGIADMLDVTQSRTVVASTKATIPPLEAQIESAINSLALLTARYPEQLRSWLAKPEAMPKVVYGASLGVPADLLRRRPDIVEAECELARYAAQVGVAKKDFLPVLSLNGSVGTTAHDVKNLFGDHSMYWEVNPTLSWTLFDGLARNYKAAEAKAQLEAAIDSYNYTVMNAVIEVSNATTAYRSSIESVRLIGEVIRQSEKSLQLAVDLYKKGLSPFSNVVDAQMNCIENQNSQITAEGNALTAVVTLYEALGGGWNNSLNLDEK